MQFFVFPIARAKKPNQSQCFYLKCVTYYLPPLISDRSRKKASISVRSTECTPIRKNLPYGGVGGPSTPGPPWNALKRHGLAFAAFKSFTRQQTSLLLLQRCQPCSWTWEQVRSIDRQSLALAKDNVPSHLPFLWACFLKLLA